LSYGRNYTTTVREKA